MKGATKKLVVNKPSENSSKHLLNNFNPVPPGRLIPPNPQPAASFFANNPFRPIPKPNEYFPPPLMPQPHNLGFPAPKPQFNQGPPLLGVIKVEQFESTFSSKSFQNSEPTEQNSKFPIPENRFAPKPVFPPTPPPNMVTHHLSNPLKSQNPPIPGLNPIPYAQIPVPPSFPPPINSGFKIPNPMLNLPNPSPQFNLFPNPPPINFPPPANQKISANIFEITFEDLKLPQAVATGDPTKCTQCSAFFSHISLINEFWKCEFCGAEQEIHLEPEEIPQHNKILYIIENLNLSLAKSKKLVGQTIIFCIDISGSMCVTVPVSSRFQIKTNKLQKMRQDLFNLVGPEWMEGGMSTQTYVSRLDCVQAAIENQLQMLAAANPDCKVGFVTFNDEVCIIGDGTSTYTLAGDLLESFEGIHKIMENKLETYLSVPILRSKDILQAKILELSESGPTALGPALLASVLLAGQSGAGSKVIVCTDGVANIGIGDIENFADLSFYETLAQLAKTQGTQVSVISISDQECRLDALRPVVEQTGGDLSKVNPETLSQDFANILSTPVYATNTLVTVRLPENLEFKDKTRVLHKDVGNVNIETMFTFEFLVKDTSEKRVPIQTEIFYKDMVGNSYVLVHTEEFEVSDDVEDVVKDADFEVLSKNAQFQGASLIKEGRLREANESLNHWSNFMMVNQRTYGQSLEYGNLIKRTTGIQQKLNERLNREESIDAFNGGEMNSGVPNLNPRPMLPKMNLGPPVMNPGLPQEFDLFNIDSSAAQMSFSLPRPIPGIPKLPSGVNSANLQDGPPPLLKFKEANFPVENEGLQKEPKLIRPPGPPPLGAPSKLKIPNFAPPVNSEGSLKGPPLLMPKFPKISSELLDKSSGGPPPLRPLPNFSSPDYSEGLQRGPPLIRPLDSDPYSFEQQIPKEFEAYNFVPNSAPPPLGGIKPSQQVPRPQFPMFSNNSNMAGSPYPAPMFPSYQADRPQGFNQESLRVTDDLLSDAMKLIKNPENKK